MDAISTSATAEVAHATTLVGEWKRFGAFLRHPALPPRAPMPRVAGFVSTLRLLALDVIIMGVLLAIAGLVTASGVKLPQTALAGMEMKPELIFAAVVFAPLAEEVAFRSWLSGRPGHVLALLTLALGLGIGFAIFSRPQDMSIAIWAGVSGLAGVVLAVVALVALRRRDAMGWFARLFPVLFWLSAILFASAHLLNFSETNHLALLPLVLPQFCVGLILGYTRVTNGLWSSMMLHLLHNGAFIGLVVLANVAA